MMSTRCELAPDGKRIQVFFSYSPEAVEAIREVPGRRFVPANGAGVGAHWTIPASMVAAMRLREEFGAGLELGPRVIAWGREENRRERQIASVHGADDATLERVSSESAAWLRPYQRADVKMMALGSVLNANQPGVGKTVEAIYAVEEAGLEGPHIVICPTSLFKDPWREELAKHAPGATVFWGRTPDDRRSAIVEVAERAAMGLGGKDWLILNPEQVRCAKVPVGKYPAQGTRVLSRDHKGNAYVPRDDFGALLYSIEWGAVVADEFHKFGLGEDRNTLFARGLGALRKNADRVYAMSGAPMGGKPIRLWGVLNFIEPDLYPAKWRWAQEWLTNADGTGPVEPGAGTGIGGIVPGREEAFYNAHAKHMVRRTRAEALPGLPPKVTIDVEVEMTPKQAKVYAAFMRRAEVALEGGNVIAAGVLAEFTRAKQFANALCTVDGDGNVLPTVESGKLPILLDRLDTFGVRSVGAEDGARAIVASESQRFVALVSSYLSEQGIACRRLDGTVTGDARDAVIDWYKEVGEGSAGAGEARVLVMTTQTGGVGLNLGMTGSIHILDETWNPDDQEQLEDRGMRDRETPLMVLYYRTAGTIQEYIAEVTLGKAVNNRNVMDLAAELRRRAAGG